MKKHFLTLCIGMLVGLMVGTASGAFAAVGDKVETIFAEFTILVNGEEKTLDATPLVYNGTSYLPVRTLANLVGFDVTYLSDTRTIELNTPTTATEEVYAVGELRKIEMIDIQILKLESNLVIQKESLVISELTLAEIKANPNISEEGKRHATLIRVPMFESVHKGILKTETELADLKAQKAALEAQLQPVQ